MEVLSTVYILNSMHYVHSISVSVGLVDNKHTLHIVILNPQQSSVPACALYTMIVQMHSIKEYIRHVAAN